MSKEKENAPNDPARPPTPPPGRAREDLSLSRKVAEIVTNLYQLSNHVRTHGLEHARIPHDSKKIITLIQRCFNATSEPELDIHVTRQGFEYHGHFLFGPGDRVKEMAVAFLARDVGRFIIKREVTEPELGAFMAALGEPAAEEDSFSALVSHLIALEVANITIEKSENESPKPRATAPDAAKPRDSSSAAAKSRAAEPEPEEPEPKAPQIEDPRLLYLALIEMMKEILAQLALGLEFQTRDLVFLTEQLAQMIPQRSRYILPFAMVRRCDRYECTHPVNTCILALSALAPVMDNPADIAQLAQSILLMDVGAVAAGELVDVAGASVPPDRTGNPVRSAIVLDRIPGLSKLPIVLAFEQHLQSDFTGYPKQPYRWTINFLTHIVSAAEQFDAMTSGKNAVCPNEAFLQLAAKIDTTVTRQAYDTLYNTVGPYPPGSLVELENGEIAVVLRFKNPLRVRKITDPAKRQLNDPHTMQASIPGGREAEGSIVRAIDANSIPICVLDYLA